MNSSDSLRRGTRGPDVFAWQRFLKAKGIYRGSINGEFDYDTERATGEYQRKNSIEVNGIVSGETLNRARRDGFVPGSEDRKPDRVQAG